MLYLRVSSEGTGTRIWIYTGAGKADDLYVNFCEPKYIVYAIV